MNELAKTDLSAIRALRRAASCKSMLRAAAGLGVKAEAVRNRISSLESRTGKHLLRRSTRFCELTSEGRLLLESYLEQLQEEVEATKLLLRPQREKRASPGARFDITLRCLDDGQWAAISRPLDLMAVSPDLIETLQKLSHELFNSIQPPTNLT
jgi:DNA-binding transcriptional LysR family regulator